MESDFFFCVYYAKYYFFKNTDPKNQILFLFGWRPTDPNFLSCPQTKKLTWFRLMKNLFCRFFYSARLEQSDFLSSIGGKTKILRSFFIFPRFPSKFQKPIKYYSIPKGKVFISMLQYLPINKNNRISITYKTKIFSFPGDLKIIF